MSDVIQCPQCDKRYRLPEKVPATFACKGCGTLMDLSGFGGAPAAPAPVAPAAAADTPRTRTQRRRGGGGGRRGRGAPAPSRHAHAGGARARGGRRGRRGQAPEDEEHGGYAQRAQKKQGNGLLIGSLIGLVAAVILVVVMVKKMGSDDPGPKKDPTKTTMAGGDGDTGTAGVTKGTTPGGTGGTPAAKGGDGDGEGDEDAPERAKKSTRVNVGGLKLQKWPWPDEVDEATRAQVDEAIENLYRGGRDGNEAEEFLISKGRVIGGRLISEFRRIEESPGFQDRDGASMCSAIETVLRKIDGVIERKFFDEEHIRASSQGSFILGQAKRWTWWWQHEEWKTNPREPFDPFSETIEDLREAAKGGKPKKKEFGKRAGDEDE